MIYAIEASIPEREALEDMHERDVGEALMDKREFMEGVQYGIRTKLG